MIERKREETSGLDDAGRATEFAELAQWEAARSERAAPRPPAREAAPSKAAPVRGGGPKRLSYLEQREWEGIESAIGAAEGEVAKLEAAAADPAIASNAAELQARYAALAAAQAEVDRLYARWSELEGKRG